LLARAVDVVLEPEVCGALASLQGRGGGDQLVGERVGDLCGPLRAAVLDQDREQRTVERRIDLDPLQEALRRVVQVELLDHPFQQRPRRRNVRVRRRQPLRRQELRVVRVDRGKRLTHDQDRPRLVDLGEDGADEVTCAKGENDAPDEQRPPNANRRDQPFEVHRVVVLPHAGNRCDRFVQAGPIIGDSGAAVKPTCCLWSPAGTWPRQAVMGWPRDAP
jgi:hypothetical protein